MKKPILKFEKPADPLRWVALLLAVMLALQFAALVYFNLFLQQSHMGFDSSWNYLKSTLIWNEKAIGGDGLWIDTSNAQLDTPTLPASLLYGITGNVFLSYGLTNLLILALIMAALWSLLSGLKLGLCAKLIALNLLLCPYLSNGFNVVNDLSYLGNMLAGASYYSVRALLALLVLREVIRFRRERRLSVPGVCSLLLCVLAGISSGMFMLIVLLVPCLVYEVIVTFIRADWKQLLRRESVYLYGCCAAVLLGRFLARHVLGIIAADVDRTWTTIERLWTNIGAVFQGFLKLIGALPVDNPNVRILGSGVWTVLPLFLLLVFIFGIGAAVKKLRKDPLAEDGVPLLLLTVLFMTVVIFSLFNSQYGSLIFEERYLIVAFLALIILAACLVDRLEPRKPFTWFILAGLIVSLAGVNVLSDRTYLQADNAAWQMDEIAETAQQKSAGLVYTWGEHSYTLGQSLRVYDMDRIYKTLDNEGYYHHWGDYLYLEKNSDYAGPTLLLAANDQLALLPEDVMDQYPVLRSLDSVTIYYSDTNPFGTY